MPLYFFDTADGVYARDTNGMEIKDDRMAKLEAIRYAGIVLSGEPDVLNEGTFQVFVSNEDAKRLFTICVTLEGGRLAGDV